MKKINVEVTMSISAMIIAIASIFISIWVGNIERKHFRLLVKPVIMIEQGFYENQNPKVKLINRGLGPATILEFKLCFDGELLSESNYYQGIHNKPDYSWDIVSISFFNQPQEE